MSPGFKVVSSKSAVIKFSSWIAGVSELTVKSIDNEPVSCVWVISLRFNCTFVVCCPSVRTLSRTNSAVTVSAIEPRFAGMSNVSVFVLSIPSPVTITSNV